MEIGCVRYIRQDNRLVNVANLRQRAQMPKVHVCGCGEQPSLCVRDLLELVIASLTNLPLARILQVSAQQHEIHPHTAEDCSPVVRTLLFLIVLSQILKNKLLNWN